MLLLTVRLGLVCNSDAIFPSVLNLVDTSLTTFAIPRDIFELLIEGSIDKLDKTTDTIVSNDATAFDLVSNTEFKELFRWLVSSEIIVL
jgi:hypothetical protein